jgi:hypothetical protein
MQPSRMAPKHTVRRVPRVPRSARFATKRSIASKHGLAAVDVNNFHGNRWRSWVERREKMRLIEIMFVPDLAARVWPAERVLLGLRVDRQIRALLRECALEVCYHASDVCTAEQAQILKRPIYLDLRSKFTRTLTSQNCSPAPARKLQPLLGGSLSGGEGGGAHAA